MQVRRRHQVKWSRSYNCRRSEADQVLVTGDAPVGTGVLRSTDRLLAPPSATPTSTLHGAKSPAKKGVTFNLHNDEDEDVDKSITPPLKDTCRYCTVGLLSIYLSISLSHF